MGYIKEPDGIDLNIGPMPLTTEDRQKISAIISQFKDSGKVVKVVQSIIAPKKRKPVQVKSKEGKSKNRAKEKALTASNSDK